MSAMPAPGMGAPGMGGPGGGGMPPPPGMMGGGGGMPPPPQQQQQQQQMPGPGMVPGGMPGPGMVPGMQGPGMVPGQGMPPPPGGGGGGQLGQPGFGGPPPPGPPGVGGMYPGAVAASPQSLVEDFSSLQLGGGGGPGGDQGVDPAAFPRPGDDVPNPNTELSCDPRYLRLTCGALPVNQTVKQRFGLPVACIVRPLIPGENVPVAQFGSTGIVRCRRCRTYINPFVQFIDGGRRFRCNVCSLPNEVPVDYFCTLDANGRRRDLQARKRTTHSFTHENIFCQPEFVCCFISSLSPHTYLACCTSIDLILIPQSSLQPIK